MWWGGVRRRIRGMGAVIRSNISSVKNKKKKNYRNRPNIAFSRKSIEYFRRTRLRERITDVVNNR